MFTGDVFCERINYILCVTCSERKQQFELGLNTFYSHSLLVKTTKLIRKESPEITTVPQSYNLHHIIELPSPKSFQNSTFPLPKTTNCASSASCCTLSVTSALHATNFVAHWIVALLS